ncbi:MAG: hypothetical protein ACODAJ_14680, partial [Planctomycetota bacterium]
RTLTRVVKQGDDPAQAAARLARAANLELARHATASRDPGGGRGGAVVIVIVVIGLVAVGLALGLRRSKAGEAGKR